MPLEVLNKPGRLTDDEYGVMRTPPRARPCAAARGPRRHARAMLDVVLHHHERIDGTGYPQRLAGEAFTPLARMGAICDVYDAITSNRPYKAGWDPASRSRAWRAGRATSTPRCSAPSCRAWASTPRARVVRLESGRLAVVVGAERRQPGRRRWSRPSIRRVGDADHADAAGPVAPRQQRPHRRPRARPARPSSRASNELWADADVLRACCSIERRPPSHIWAAAAARAYTRRPSLTSGAAMKSLTTAAAAGGPGAAAGAAVQAQTLRWASQGDAADDGPALAERGPDQRDQRPGLRDAGHARPPAQHRAGAGHRAGSRPAR